MKITKKEIALYLYKDNDKYYQIGKTNTEKGLFLLRRWQHLSNIGHGFTLGEKNKKNMINYLYNNSLGRYKIETAYSEMIGI